MNEIYMQKIVLGLCGLSGSGKDAVADILVAEHGYVKISLADELKRILMKLYKFSEEQLWGSKKNELDYRYPREAHDWGVGIECLCCGATRPSQEEQSFQCYLTPRYAMQMLGTEVGRRCYPDTWTYPTMSAALGLLAMRADGSEGVM